MITLTRIYWKNSKLVANSYVTNVYLKLLNYHETIQNTAGIL